MDYKSIQQQAENLSSWLTPRVIQDRRRRAHSATYEVGHVGDHTQGAIVKVAKQIGANLQSDSRNGIEGFFTVTEERPAEGQVVSLFLVYKRA